MIVVDTNIIVYFLLPTALSDAVDELYKLEPNWVAPLLWKSEFRNVLALYLRRRVIDLDKALQIQENAELLMAQNEFEVVSPSVLALAAQSHCSAYDSEFVALSRRLNIPLITQDKKLLQTFSTSALSIEDFLAQQD